MNKKILYKLLLIFVLLIFTLLISNTKCFAATYTDDVYNSTYVENAEDTLQSIYYIIDNNQDIFNFTSSELPVNQFVVKYSYNGNTFYKFFAFSFDTVFKSSKTNESEFVLSYLGSGLRYELSVHPTGFNASNDGQLIEYTHGSDTELDYLKVEFSEGYIFCSSNFNLLNEKGDVLFQQPPPVQEQATTLAPIVEEMETEKTLVEIVTILPVVLVVIVGLLAIRKAIKFLMKTLKQG